MSYDVAERIVLEDECQQISGLARSTRFQLEREGKFPRRRQLARGDRRVGWLYSELVEWMRSRPPLPEKTRTPRELEAAAR